MSTPQLRMRGTGGGAGGGASSSSASPSLRARVGSGGSFRDGSAGKGASNSAPSALERARERVQKLPDPTLLFLLETAVLLAIHTWRAHWLRTWLARALVPLVLAPTVAAAAIWRRTVARHATPPDDVSWCAPSGILPDASALVAKGVALRKKDALIYAEEKELRKGQIKLEMLRKEIDSRLPSHNSMAALIGPDGDQNEIAKNLDKVASIATLPRSHSVEPGTATRLAQMPSTVSGVDRTA